MLLIFVLSFQSKLLLQLSRGLLLRSGSGTALPLPAIHSVSACPDKPPIQLCFRDSTLRHCRQDVVRDRPTTDLSSYPSVLGLLCPILGLLRFSVSSPSAQLSSAHPLPFPRLNSSAHIILYYHFFFLFCASFCSSASSQSSQTSFSSRFIGGLCQKTATTTTTTNNCLPQGPPRSSPSPTLTITSSCPASRSLLVRWYFNRGRFWFLQHPEWH